MNKKYWIQIYVTKLFVFCDMPNDYGIDDVL